MTQDEQDEAFSIACTLTPEDMATKRGGLLPGLVENAVAREPVAGGLRWRFAFQEGLLTEIAAVIEAEHRCCRFLRFDLSVRPGHGPAVLEVTGPNGTQEFLQTLVDDTTSSTEHGVGPSPQTVE